MLLLRIRSERDQFTAIERRIADFILENASLLRDYSSQQIANALDISQSSVVKFAQKLGFKGYPDLKYSVGESLTRQGANRGDAASMPPSQPERIGDALWLDKDHARAQTLLLNPPARFATIVKLLLRAGCIHVIGLGEDDLHARSLTQRLAMGGFNAVHHFDVAQMMAALALSHPRDVLVVFSEHGGQPALGRLAAEMHALRGIVISVTRHSANALRVQADQSLLVSAHHEDPCRAIVLYHAALQHLMDVLYLQLCAQCHDAAATLRRNLDRIDGLYG